MEADKLYKKLAEMDVLVEHEQAFDEQRGKNGVAWAIETTGPDVFGARMLARLIRPVLKARPGLTDDEWLVHVRAARGDAARRLTDGHWRHNSSSMLQNAINQWESEALSKFVWLMGRYLD